MGPLNRLIAGSVAHPVVVLIALSGFIGLGLWSLDRITFDAFPDLTNVQVQVLTASPGMASEEVELLVTLPVERALSGTPRLKTLRSLSRTGISSVTAVFEDGTDLYFARQLIQSRLKGAEGDIPPTAGTPEMAPPTTGLGEVYQFTFQSDRHPLPTLARIFERDVAPRLRTIPGVVEVNVWGGGTPQVHVDVDPFRLAHQDLAFDAVAKAVEGALGIASGGAQPRGAEQVLIRGRANPTDLNALDDLEVARRDGVSIPLSDVATIRPGRALTVGMGSADGEGEALFVMVQLLAGADALEVAEAVDARVAEIRESLPDGVILEGVYDRRVLVGSTLRTVITSLVEGGALVILVLLLLLGDLRAGLLVASVIPLSMLGAFTGLYAFGYSGNLMSLGAIDFGLIVDGTIVVVESLVGVEVARRGAMGPQVAARAQSVCRPVLFAVGILLLVYMPIVLMQGTEGKLFRPMALTVLFALATALILTFTYVPAMAALVIKPGHHQAPLLARAMLRLYRPALDWSLRRPALATLLALGVFGGTVGLVGQLGVEFVPRLEEGDLVVQTARLPSLSPTQALREATRIEGILRSFPEVKRVASRTGAPALATDPMGLEEADILVQLAPRSAWRTAHTTEGLVQAMSARLSAEAPGAAYTFTQPIEMRFNELLEGITSDVGVKIYGPDHGELRRLGQQVASALEGVTGASDVTAPTLEGVPSLDVVLPPAPLARYGVAAGALLDQITATRRGLTVGEITRGQFRDPVMLRLSLPPGVPLADLPIVIPGGGSVPLDSLAQITDTQAAATIDREDNSRRVVVEANVRGRDLGGFITEAQRAVAEAVPLPDGYWMTWGGQYAQLEAAAARARIMLPAVLILILLTLYGAFQGLRPALMIFLNVPVAASGGLLALWLRDMPLSMSAIVGAIALFGVAVMNGVVLLSRTQALHQQFTAPDAARHSALERFRPVMMTASVAGIGFLPMATATGVGAEVQIPLATVVIGGLITSTLLTLLVLPALYARFMPQAPTGEAHV